MNGQRFSGYLAPLLLAIAVLAASCGQGDDTAAIPSASDNGLEASDDSPTTSAEPSGAEDDASAETSEAPNDSDMEAEGDTTTSASDAPSNTDEDTTTTDAEGTTSTETTEASSETTQSTTGTTESTTETTRGPATPCLIRLHGKGGDGGNDSVYQNDIKQLTPRGNDEAWNGYQWLYFPEDRYRETVDILTATVEAGACTDVVLNGFSNGAAFAGKLYCQGEDLGGRLRGVVVDDPVPDNGTANCSPAAGVGAALYWTGALAGSAPAGADCNAIDWTCEGGTSAGIAKYAQDMGTEAQASPFEDHQWYWDAPEILQFFG